MGGDGGNAVVYPTGLDFLSLVELTCRIPCSIHIAAFQFRQEPGQHHVVILVNPPFGSHDITGILRVEESIMPGKPGLQVRCHFQRWQGDDGLAG